VSLRKLITAAAGTEGMAHIVPFDLLLAMADLASFFRTAPVVIHINLLRKSKHVPRHKP
jgi:hypothetical protein